MKDQDEADELNAKMCHYVMNRVDAEVGDASIDTFYVEIETSMATSARSAAWGVSLVLACCSAQIMVTETLSVLAFAAAACLYYVTGGAGQARGPAAGSAEPEAEADPVERSAPEPEHDVAPTVPARRRRLAAAKPKPHAAPPTVPPARATAVTPVPAQLARAPIGQIGSMDRADKDEVIRMLGQVRFDHGGKHQGSTFEEVKLRDPQHVQWLARNYNATVDATCALFLAYSRM